MVRKRPLELTESLERFLQASLWTMLASGYLAVAFSGELDPVSLAVGALALLLRLAHLTGVARISIPAFWVNAAALLCLLFFPADLFFLSRDFVRAVVHMIICVAVLKLLTASTARDSALLGVVAFLEMLAACVLSTNVTFLLLLIPFLGASIAALASAEIRRSLRGREVVRAGGMAIGRRLTTLTVLSSGVILVLTAGLFLVLPRTARAALEHFLPTQQRVSGFATEVTLGNRTAIARSGTPVLHALFQGEPPRADLHWRGTALAQFNGRTWSAPRTPGSLLRVNGDGLVQLVSDNQRRREGRRVVYEVVLNGASEYLFVAGLPENLRVGADSLIRDGAGGVKLPFGPGEGLRYAVYSFVPAGGVVDEAPPQRLSDPERERYLQLPALDPRVMQLARAVTANTPDEEARADALEHYLKTRFAYSLEPGSADAADPLAAFLFVDRRGHCEEFASAMAVMLRSLSIPSRVVTGFLGGAKNPLTNWMVLRASDAHAWVEAWIPGQGWTTFDPTPAGGPDTAAVSWLARLNNYLDAGSTLWQEWVVGYDLDRQMTLAFRFDQSRRAGVPWLVRTFRNAMALRLPGLPSGSRASGGGIAIAVLALALALAFVFRRRIAALPRAMRRAGANGHAPITVHEAARLYRAMLAALRRRGIEKLPFQTAAEFAAGLGGHTASALVTEFTLCYESVRFGRESDRLGRLETLLRRIEALPK